MYKRDGKWWTCIRYKGKKIQRSLETDNKSLALSIESKLRTELIEGKYFDKYEGENKTFKELVEKFMKEHSPKVSPKTQRAYERVFKHTGLFFRDMCLSEITPKRIAEYRASRYNEKAMPATVNQELAVLGKAFSLALKEWEWIKENPVNRIKRDRENNQRDKWLSYEDEQRLLENSPGWLREIIVFDLNTGLRQDELLSLPWDKVNLLRKTIIIQKSKNGKPRTVPLTSVAMGILEEKVRIRSLKSNFVFTNREGKRFDCGWVWKSFSNLAKNVGIEDFHFHDLRHTFATRLAQGGIDLYKISKLLGHINITMTQRYTHHCPESLREGIEVLEKADYNLTTMRENRNVSNA